MKKSIMVLCLLLLMTGIAFGQHYTDWTGFEYLPGRLDSKDRVVFYELQKDYTINISDYFAIPEKLPDCCEIEAGGYQSLAKAPSRRAQWDFITFDLAGILTIKKGYRWDGASYLCKEWDGDAYCPDEYFNFRSSLVHDVLYDLMRMGYHKHDDNHGMITPFGTCEDYHILWGDGDDNRRFADMVHYMIAMEDSCSKSDAQSDYFWLRVWGACATFDDDKLAGWKYHVNELTAYASNGKVELKWNRTNEAGKDPDFDGHSNPIVGYSIERNGEEIATVPPFILFPRPGFVTSYTDNDVVNGTTYTYRLLPLEGNKNQDDWSNQEIVIPMDGPGNALKLDGIDDYVEANTLSNDLFEYNLPPDYPCNISYEAWVYPENKDGAIIAFNSIDGGDIFILYYNAGSQKFCHYDTANGNIYSTDEFPVNNWYHVAITINMFTDEGNLYVNGEQQATFDASFDNPLKYGSRFSIGQEWTTDQTMLHFKGKIDEARVWKTERTQNEIQGSMNVPLRGYEEGLVGLWHFDEPHETNYFRVAHEATSNANDATLMGYANEDRPFTPSGAMGVATDISDGTDNIKQIPYEFSLQQNYPNPFNPSTKIEFAIPRAEFVTLDIFNILGKKVETLISKQMSAGNYSVTWDASMVSSGIYLYKINAGAFSETKKMTLLK